MRIVVDYDGVLATFNKLKNGGKPIKANIDKLKRLQKMGHEIVVLTARRYDSPSGFEDILSVINTSGLRIQEIWLSAKPKAFLYVDDFAVNPTEKGWYNKALKLLKRAKKIEKLYGKERMNMPWSGDPWKIVPIPSVIDVRILEKAMRNLLRRIGKRISNG